MKKPQILILGLVYGFLGVYRLLGSDLTNVKGTVAIASKLKCHCESASGGRSNLIAAPVVAQFIGRFLPDKSGNYKMLGAGWPARGEPVEP
jgi:hypothetical protein